MTPQSQRPVARFWVGLGSARAVRIIFVLMILYFLVIGGLVLGYSNVQSCLAKYSDLSAKALQIRVQTGSDDRALNQRILTVDASDRARIIANQLATRQLIQSTVKNGGVATRSALVNFLKVGDDSIAQFQKNEVERTRIAAERLRIDQVRATAPNPGPPSESC